MSKQKKSARAHHYVPQGYLKHFADLKGHIHVYEKSTGKVFCSGTKNIGQRRDFYAMPTANGLDDRVEMLLANQYDDFLAKVLSVLHGGITHDRRYIVSSFSPAFQMFTALQMVRTPRIRRQILEISQQELGAAGIGTKADGERLAVRVHLDMLVNGKVAEFAEYFSRLHGRLLVSPSENPFLTSDHPVCTCIETGNEGKVNLTASQGIGRPGVQVIYPLTQRVTYVLTHTPLPIPEDRIQFLGSEQVDVINRLTWANAERQIYSATPFSDSSVKRLGVQ